jgi:hypothetical protein
MRLVCPGDDTVEGTAKSMDQAESGQPWAGSKLFGECLIRHGAKIITYITPSYKT